MYDHLSYALKHLELMAQDVLARQCLDPSSPLHGAVEGEYLVNTGAHSGGITPARILLLAYYAKGSALQGQEILLERACLALDYSLRCQHEDGTFDLLETNFHDGAETSFIAQSICPIALLMRSFPPRTPLEERARALMDELIANISNGIVDGGFHTPNHRWVMSAALLMCNLLTGRKDCLDKMQALLNEGIDCDEEGEYTERSSGVYNIICDRALITLAQFGKRPELLEHVKRNLRMVIKYIEPDLTINTANSTRQDAGSAPDWRIYYGLYLFIALKTGDEEFRFIADRMLEQSQSAFSEAGLRAGQDMIPYFEYLPYVLMDETLAKPWTQAQTRAPEMNFIHHFVQSGIVRARQGDLSLTLIKQNPVPLSLKYKKHTLGLRLAGTFYSRGQFAAQSLTQLDETGFEMRYVDRWGYKGPLPEKPQTTNWREMDHSLRPQVMMQDYVLTLRIHLIPGGVRLHLSTQGVENVLMKLEILLEGGARLSTDSTEMHTRAGDYIYHKRGRALYIYPDHVKLLLSEGAFSHAYGRNMRGTLPGDDRHVFLALTAQTPWEQELELRFEG